MSNASLTQMDGLTALGCCTHWWRTSNDYSSPNTIYSELSWQKCELDRF